MIKPTKRDKKGTKYTTVFVEPIVTAEDIYTAIIYRIFTLKCRINTRDKIEATLLMLLDIKGHSWLEEYYLDFHKAYITKPVSTYTVNPIYKSHKTDNQIALCKKLSEDLFPDWFLPNSVGFIKEK
jgi:hypothetical protein